MTACSRWWAVGWVAVLSVKAAAGAPDCPVESNVQSRRNGARQTVVFENRLSSDVQLFWLGFDNQEHLSGVVGGLSDLNSESFVGHAFRTRSVGGSLLSEYVVTSTRDQHHVIRPCGSVAEEEPPLWEEGRDAEFESLLIDHSQPCEPADNSKHWSCVAYYTREDVAKRNRSLYGFQPGEVRSNREYNTYDTTYTAQIAMIPKVSPTGNGYQVMNMTDRLRNLLFEFYDARKHDSMISHGVIAGGYTNNDKVEIHKIDLDRFRSVHKAIIREMQQVLQWWTKLRLKHTSTFGVRIYRRDSLLIDHVDRMDTHLASAVLQVAQTVDDHGGWPLEVLLPDGNVGEVYLQPGQMVLYEGAWLRHGRPMRFRGDEFANIFSHFAPLDWKGPHSSESPHFYGYVKGRCTTIADDDPRGRCRVNGKYLNNEVELKLPTKAQGPTANDEL